MSLSVRCPPDQIEFDPRINAYICRLTGEVIEDSPVDTGPEWRSFDSEDRARRSRVGAPLTHRVHDRGLTTFIRSSARDPRARKLAAIQSKLRASMDKRLIQLLHELNSQAARLGLTLHHGSARIVEEAAAILRRLYSSDAKYIAKRNNMARYCAASLVIAARIDGKLLLDIRTVSRKLGLNPKDVWDAYRDIYFKVSVKSRPRKPTQYVSQIVSKLKLSPDVERLATKFTTLLERSGLAQGKPPLAVAAGAVYLASILLNEKRKQSTIASAVSLTDATIRNRYRDIVDNFYIEVNLEPIDDDSLYGI